ncbi:MAG: hypothetical protein NW215_05115 [Hyphomicrobiales bacterium]|nr:hypothetical protein [Hyphomicrobiales bacterium]
MSRANRQRAQRAKAVLDHFAALADCHDTPDAVVDLIANLGHLCDRRKLDFLHLASLGVGHWRAEQRVRDAWFLPLSPAVTITIDNESLPQ